MTRSYSTQLWDDWCAMRKFQESEDRRHRQYCERCDKQIEEEDRLMHNGQQLCEECHATVTEDA